MSYPHQVIINYIRHVISWETVRFQNDLVIYCIVVEDHLSVDHIFKLSFTPWHKHSDHVRLA